MTVSEFLINSVDCHLWLRHKYFAVDINRWRIKITNNLVDCQYQQKKLLLSLNKVHMLVAKLYLSQGKLCHLLRMLLAGSLCCTAHFPLLTFQLLEVSTLLTTAVDEQMCIQSSFVEHKVSETVYTVHKRRLLKIIMFTDYRYNCIDERRLTP